MAKARVNQVLEWPADDEYRPNEFYYKQVPGINPGTLGVLCRFVTDEGIPQDLMIDPELLQALIDDAVAGYSANIKGTYEAGAIISGGKALYMGTDNKVYPWNMGDPNTFNFLGLSENAALAGEDVVVLKVGVSETIGSGMTVGKTYYIGANGSPTLNPPNTGFCLQLGIPVAPDIFYLNPKEGTILA